MIENIKEEIEDKVIDLIVSGAKGRLIVFKPVPTGRQAENSDPSAQAGKDLVVEKRADYKKKVISLNIYVGDFFVGQNIKKEIYKLAGEKKINAQENFYLAFVHFDVIKQDISDNFWVIPSVDLQNSAGKNDFSKFLTNKKDFVGFLIKAL
jgi:hypothetical protein